MIADTHSSAATASTDMGGAHQFDMPTNHHPNGQSIPRISVR